ncbi:MAG: ABC transporter substrate-binding protein [Oliverpabstia sp.]
MKVRMKKIVAIMLAGMMTLSFAACGTGEAGKNDGEGGKAAEEDGKITIKITWWGGQSRHDYTQKLLDAYTAENPNVEFEALPSGWDGYFEKMSTQAASGSMPDIVQMDYLYISTYAKNNTLTDLTPYIEDGTIDTTYIDEKILASGEVDGKMAGMVLSSSALAVGYNPEVLEEAGVETPADDWTWSDYIALNKTVSDQTGSPSATISAGITGDTNVFNYWVRQHGESLFNEDGTALGYEDDQITAGYFQMWKDMIDANIAPDPDEEAQIQTLGQEAGPVVTGEAATNIEWNNYAAKLNTVNDNLKITLPPRSDDGAESGLWVKPGMFFSIAENSEVKEECAKFINWFINSEEANDIIMAERGTPVSSEIRQYMIDSGMLNDQQIEMFEYIDKAAEIAGETPAPDPTGISEVNEAFANAGNRVFYGQATAEEAAAEFREEANAILERNNK